MTINPAQSFWSQLPKPIMGLSPMDDITDHPFRHIQKKYGSPDVIYTEFTSVEGVCHGADRLLKDFLYDESQRPVIGQIYGTTPDFFRQTATVLCELGFDGVDINMGCPAKNVAHSGAGAALIINPNLAQEIIKATQAGIEDYVNGKRARDCANITESIWQEVERRHALLPHPYQQLRSIPVSIKTRIGYNEEVISEWIPTLLELKPAAIALHGRTLKQRYAGFADWEAIGKAAEIVKKTDTLILGNGDVTSLPDALQKIKDFNLDGVLIGRSTWGNPFVFIDETPAAKPDRNLFQIALEHAYAYETAFKDSSHYIFIPMRKHLGWYVKGVPNAAQIRSEVFQSNSADEVKQIFEKYGVI